MELYVINELWEQSRGKHVYCQFRVVDRLTSLLVIVTSAL